MRVALSGGVGSGKSTVAALLAGHGAVIIDADAVAREVVEPGAPGFDAVVARFGDRVVAAGRLDRHALAKIVFGDQDALKDLNTIVHPLVRQRTAELMHAAAPDAVVVYDVPLLVESKAAESKAAESYGAQSFDKVVIVEASQDTRLARLEGRGMPESDARARIAAQASDEQRRAVADELITNDDTLEHLEAAVDRLWDRLTMGKLV